MGMQFVTLRVTRRFCDVRWIGVRLRSPLLSQTPLVPHAPRGNTVRDAPRHTAVLRCQVDRGSTQVTFVIPDAARSSRSAWECSS
ncbi:hypothetical protein FFH21_010830 [Pseudomonas sp. KBS0707]|nr:hypothetical protein DND36_15245 [Pseudomonas savastanoi pv. glycinea]QDW00297.1 hypothetical protein FFH21_010830 [Pseudomonas sp. KBS0707]